MGAKKYIIQLAFVTPTKKKFPTKKKKATKRKQFVSPLNQKDILGICHITKRNKICLYAYIHLVFFSLMKLEIISINIQSA